MGDSELMPFDETDLNQLRQVREELRNRWRASAFRLLDATIKDIEGRRRSPEGGGWLPIESAPKDGTEILLWGACRPRNSLSRYGTDANVGWWCEHGWQTRVGGEVCDAVYWQPIARPGPSRVSPAPSQAGASDTGEQVRSER